MYNQIHPDDDNALAVLIRHWAYPKYRTQSVSTFLFTLCFSLVVVVAVPRIVAGVTKPLPHVEPVFWRWLTLLFDLARRLVGGLRIPRCSLG